MKSVLFWTRERIVQRPRIMKHPLLELLFRVTLLALFLPPNTSEAFPIRDDTLGDEADVWHDTVVQQFYGPWSNVHKLNGENADYNDYGAYIQDFEPAPEDIPEDEPEVGNGGVADFQSNYGEIAGDEFGGPFQPSADDQSVGNQDGEDQIVGGDPENHDFEGNVQWTSAAM